MPQDGKDLSDTQQRIVSIDKGRRSKLLMELGRTGLKRYHGSISEEFLKTLTGGRAVRVYNEMSLNDGTIGGMLFAIEQLLKQASWWCEPADKSSEAKLDAQFVDECRGDMSHSWMDFIDEVLTFLQYGWSWFEVVYKIRDGVNSEYSDGRFAWRKFAPRSQDSFHAWLFDDRGGVQGMIQRPPPDFKEFTVPIGKSLHFRTKSIKNSPEGKSILRNAYRPWYFKKRFEELEGIGVERDLVGLPKLVAPEGLNLEEDKHESTRRWAQEIITNIRNDEQAGLLLPFGWEFELVGSPGEKQFNVTEIISRCDHQIAMSCLAQFMFLGIEGVGSFALSENQMGLFHRCLEGWMKKIAEVMNRIAIPRLFALNGMKRKAYPILAHGAVAEESLREISGYVFRLMKSELIKPGDPEIEGLKRFLLNMGIFKNMRKDWESS